MSSFCEDSLIAPSSAVVKKKSPVAPLKTPSSLLNGFQPPFLLNIMAGNVQQKDRLKVQRWEVRCLGCFGVVFRVFRANGSGCLGCFGCFGVFSVGF